MRKSVIVRFRDGINNCICKLPIFRQYTCFLELSDSRGYVTDMASRTLRITWRRILYCLFLCDYFDLCKCVFVFYYFTVGHARTFHNASENIYLVWVFVTLEFKEVQNRS